MLSILIPAYNYNITKLVGDLHQQAVDATIEFEIIVMEDGSTLFLDENKTVSELEFCRYISLEENIGRSAIRNKLGDEAKYAHLLFLDCDTGISHDAFIRNYIPFCHQECVVLGGRIYEENIDSRHSLLAGYGKERERNDAENVKKREKYRPFTSPNFLIPKSIFNKIRFDESIKNYGHEDTIFGVMLKRESVAINCIDNPVVHIGIEDNRAFVDKTEKALYNLFSLHHSGKYPGLASESKILTHYLRLERCYLVPVIALIHKICRNQIKKNLFGATPSLFLFDLYKLGVLCSFSSEEEKRQKGSKNKER
jgi:glycosyltransferase involved in cell wall biosynthesis